MGINFKTLQHTARMLRHAGVQAAPLVNIRDQWKIYPAKHYPRAFKLGSIKKKGRHRQYLVWVNGGDPVSFPTKAERRAFIESTLVLREANDG